MGERKFPYVRHQFILNSVLFIILTVVLMFVFLPLEGSDSLTLAVIAALGGLMTVVLGLSPLFTYHGLDEDAMVLRQGLYFRARVPYDEMLEVRRVERGPMRTGVYFRVREGTLFVTSRRNDLIELKLKAARPFGWALGKKADNVVFDSQDNRALLRELERRSGLTPSNPDLSF